MPVSDSAVFDALRHLAEEAPVGLFVRGTCMVPLLADGDRIVVERCRRYWPGDVVALRSQAGPLLVHRLLGPLRRSGSWWVLSQGDALSAPDEPVPWDALLGRVRETEDRGSLRPGWAGRARAAGRYLRHLARTAVGR
ncbi:MAG: S24/S26 family peptidase [Thermoanaerobaculia bacterium]